MSSPLDHVGTCPSCHNKGSITIDTWVGKPVMNHCSRCGYSWPRFPKQLKEYVQYNLKRVLEVELV